jgi:hypothetical protein
MPTRRSHRPWGAAPAPSACTTARNSAIAEMLKSGTTCFCGTGYFPDESARTALERGCARSSAFPSAKPPAPGQPPASTSPGRWNSAMNTAVIPASRRPSPRLRPPRSATPPSPRSPPWPTKSSRPHHAAARLAAEVEDSIARHGLRPLERMQRLGLLTPALTAVHMAHIDAQDRELAQRGGIALTLCPEADAPRESAARSTPGPAPVCVSAWAAARLPAPASISGATSNCLPCSRYPAATSLRFWMPGAPCRRPPAARGDLGSGSGNRHPRAQ